MAKVKDLLDAEANSLASYLEKVKASMERILELRNFRGQAEGMEQVELDRLVNLSESYYDDINILHKDVSYLSKKRIEGKIYLAQNGLYRIDGVNIDLKEGYPIELFIEVEGVATWQIGRLIREHSSNKYCFLGESSKGYLLKPGMLAAIRLASLTHSQTDSCQGHQV
ncbi:hypothetical protein [Desulforamulus aquiferis]|uniref:DUF5348 domain-containing protein n=1 Tax=Desulforamulus aquiferis TaxID=1397668 RepID=A0AAW7ZDN5_9FIRM|nr:hypothetical protein [Desulforamulus aquiferis]MDO7787548.1 hypothetical protein [Desulforamulus aquiferis]RYD01591.1 hypothetical protein N752_28870 [Desulforamulus aquiferis]